MRPIIVRNELIKENYSYESLLYDIKKNGYKNPLEIDYCIKDNNNLIIFRILNIKSKHKRLFLEITNNQ